MNYSGKTRPCSKGCGAEIYWDEEFKSDSGKFIPIDSRTDEPHRCDGPTKSDYFPDEIKQIKKKEVAPKPKIPIPQEILYDISKIPKSLVDDDFIIHEIIQGHKEESLAIVHYENMVSPEPGNCKVWIYWIVAFPRRISSLHPEW
jgi:DEAD/DEAH box helicase domain-containing protein